jgi:hypothetical protein
MGRIEHLFNYVARKPLNALLIAKIAIRIEANLRKIGIDPKNCIFAVEEFGERPIAFKLQAIGGKLLGTVAEYKIDPQLPVNIREEIALKLGCLGWGLAECGVMLHKSIGVTGLPIKHRAQFGSLRDYIGEVQRIVRDLRKKKNLI